MPTETSTEVPQAQITDDVQTVLRQAPHVLKRSLRRSGKQKVGTIASFVASMDRGTRQALVSVTADNWSPPGFVPVYHEDPTGKWWGHYEDDEPNETAAVLTESALRLGLSGLGYRVLSSEMPISEGSEEYGEYSFGFRVEAPSGVSFEVEVMALPLA